MWRYADVREEVMEAGRLISAREAERRVLILENPALSGQSRITSTLYAGLQLILPGEIAPAHRHSQSALRLVLDGEGAYTAVDGERTTMHRGDFIVTPARTWHDHGNPGGSPVVWLDGLDIPLVQFFDAGFMERSPEEFQSELRPEGDALARYGRNMVPVDYAPSATEPTRMFAYPFGETRAALQALARGAPDPHFGHKLRFVNPATGASPMPTIGAFAQWLPRGSRRGAIGAPTARSTCASRAPAKPAFATRHSRSARTTSSSCRRGTSSSWSPRAARCCSAFPTARRSRRWASGATTRPADPRPAPRGLLAAGPGCRDRRGRRSAHRLR